MIALRPVALVAACALVGACATAGVEGAPPDEGAPAPLADHDWVLGEDLLLYGLAESDDVWLSLGCAPGSGQVEITQWTAVGAARDIHLESGGETERWPARAEPSELTGENVLVASAQTGHPVFQRFEDLGWLALWGARGRMPMAAHPGSADEIRSFFSACR